MVIPMNIINYGEMPIIIHLLCFYIFHRNRPIMTFIIIYYIFELIPKNKFTLKNW